MRVKKQKEVRRSVGFYKACCGFREPFKVLCDGHFVHAVLAARVGSLRDTLPALLGGGAKAFVIRCVIGELKKLGEAFSGTVLAARRLDIAKCNHDPLLPAVDFMEAMVGTKNPEHFFVATQDAELRRKLRKVKATATLLSVSPSCGAVIFLQNTGLVLEKQSSLQKSYACLSEAERLHMSNQEEMVLVERVKRKSSQVSDTAIGDADQSLDLVGLNEEGHENQRTSEFKEVSRLKRQRAKAPNPLSQKKKQKKSAGGTSQQVPCKEEDTAEGPIKKMKRQRHRVRRKKSVDGNATILD